MSASSAAAVHPTQNYDVFLSFRERFKDSIEKVDMWRSALSKAANLSGFDNSKKTGTEVDFVEKVVEGILTKLIRKSSSKLEGLVGIERHIQHFESLLCINDSLDVCTVDIWGMGGIGKTTLADAISALLTIGSDLIRKRLLSTKVLIVLDDVNDSRQLDHLLGDGMGVGAEVESL
ncbi:PREDICTED: TMV resistance [Prunus dulcis]|uniref:PREDICTED: TMV resistance n=1 Tax=Prunus dulcis TaxID=3755 RepID=A0A5E4GQ52_PRUDU|nr:PREDICTED: TMV resistance [Prunus dulcis]